MPPDPHADTRPWTVIVRDGRVVSRYRAEPDRATASAAAMPIAMCNDAADLWEVAAGQPEPPPEGQPVDPVKLGWTCVTTRACKPQSQAWR
jgi:hypothetical protein